MTTVEASDTGVPALSTGRPLTSTLPAAHESSMHRWASVGVCAEWMHTLRGRLCDLYSSLMAAPSSRDPACWHQHAWPGRTLHNPRLNDVARVLGVQLQAHLIQAPLPLPYLHAQTMHAVASEHCCVGKAWQRQCCLPPPPAGAGLTSWAGGCSAALHATPLAPRARTAGSRRSCRRRARQEGRMAPEAGCRRDWQ